MSGNKIARSSRILALSAALVGFAACSAQTGSSTLQAAQMNGGIIGGTLATGSEDFAKTVVILYDKALGAMCTASIISDKLLITAAHCVASDPKDLYVVFGTDIEATDIVVRRAVAAETTPIWVARQNEQLNTGDLALVAFAGGLPAGYQAAHMLGDISKLKDGDTATLAGYGESDGVAGTGAGKLRYVDIAISKVALSQSEILFDQSGGKGACHGDSGGPAYATVDGVRLLVGVTSRGAGVCNSVAIYTNIPYYASWIVREAKVLSAQVPALPADPTQDPAATPVVTKKSRKKAAPQDPPTVASAAS